MCRVCPSLTVFLLQTTSNMTLQKFQRLINYDRSLISRHKFGIKAVTGSLHKNQLGFHTMRPKLVVSLLRDLDVYQCVFSAVDEVVNSNINEPREDISRLFSAFVFSQVSMQRSFSRIRPHQIVSYIRNTMNSLSDVMHSLHYATHREALNNEDSSADFNSYTHLPAEELQANRHVTTSH